MLTSIAISAFVNCKLNVPGCGTVQVPAGGQVESPPLRPIRCGPYFQSEAAGGWLDDGHSTVGPAARFLEPERLTRRDDHDRVMKEAVEEPSCSRRDREKVSP